MKKDITKKRLEDHNDVFVDIFNVLLFEGEEVLSAEYLVPLPTEAFSRKNDGTLRQGNRDVRKADKRNGRYRLICGEENQEGIDNTMPQRLMGYDYASYEEQIKDIISENKKAGRPAVTKRIHDSQKLAPVITILLYWGTEPWESPLDLHDMLAFPSDVEEKIKPYVANYPMNIIQMATLPEEVRNKFKSDFRLLAEYAACKNNFSELTKLVQDKTREIHHPEEFLDALSAVAGDKRYETIKEQINQRTEKEGVTMCVIAEALENRGIERGIEKGMRKGIQKGIERGVEALILDNLEEGKTEKQILDKLERRFSVSSGLAKEYFDKYGIAE